MYSLQRFVFAFFDLIAITFSNWLFVITQRGAARRKWLLILLGAFLWAFLAWKKHPPILGMEPFRNFIEYPFVTLFAADVFRHVLIAGSVFWLAYRIAAIYLDDIFELNNINIAERFIRQAAFASQYNVIEIRNGEVAQRDKLSPIFLIGGPGMVRVHLENAALFEKIDGEAHVISPSVRIASGKIRNNKQKQSASPAKEQENSGRPPSDGVEILEGFERLRSVIDLRDQFEDLSVKARTRDGINIEIKDVRYVFSVYRDYQQPTLSRPYPFQNEAVENLVFEQSKQHWSNTMRGLIKRRLNEFISKRTLSEFLAAINIPELEQDREEEMRIQQSADRLAGAANTQQQSTYEAPIFTPRSELTNIFYDFTSEFTKDAKEVGVEMRWIGVGTWITSDEIIPEQHIKAWRITRDNITRSGEQALTDLEGRSRNIALMGLIQDTIIGSNHYIKSEEGDDAIALRQIVETYRAKLRSALDIYEQSDGTRSPEARRLRSVLEQLARVSYRWLGDAND